jgi:agarase
VVRRFSTVVSIGLLALLVGCGGGGGGGGSSSGSSSGSGNNPPPDTTPAAFEIPKVANAVRGGWSSSAAITISGINAAAQVTVTNGEYSINGGAFTAAAGTVSNGQSIVVRVQAGSGWSAASRATLTVGGVSAEFEIVSELPGYLPDAVAFDGQDVVYLLSSANRLVFRWSVSESRYLGAYTVGLGALNPTKMA